MLMNPVVMGGYLNIRCRETNQFWIGASQRSHSHLSPAAAHPHQQGTTAVPRPNSLSGRPGAECSIRQGQRNQTAALRQTEQGNAYLLQDGGLFADLRVAPAHGNGSGAGRSIASLFQRSQNLDRCYRKGLVKFNQAYIVASQEKCFQD